MGEDEKEKSIIVLGVPFGLETSSPLEGNSRFEGLADKELSES